MKYLLGLILLAVSFGIDAQNEMDISVYEFYADTRDGFEIWKHKKTKKYGAIRYHDEKIEIVHPFKYDDLQEEIYNELALVGKKEGKYYLLNAKHGVAVMAFDDVVTPEDLGFSDFQKPFLCLKKEGDFQIFRSKEGLSDEKFSFIKPIVSGNYYMKAQVGDDGTTAIFDFMDFKYVYRPGDVTKFEYSDELNTQYGREDLAIISDGDKLGLFGLDDIEGIEFLAPIYHEISPTNIEYLSGVLKVVKGDSMNLFSLDEKAMILPRFIVNSDIEREEFVGDQLYFLTRVGKKRGVFNQDLSIHIPANYTKVYLNEDYPEMIEVWNKKKIGFFKGSNPYIPCEYTKVDPYVGEIADWEVIKVFNKKKQGIFMDHVLAIPCEYTSIDVDYEGNWYAVSKGRKHALYHNDQLKLPLEYDSVQLMNGDLGKVAYLIKGDKAWYYSADGKMEETKVSR